MVRKQRISKAAETDAKMLSEKAFEYVDFRTFS